MSAKAVSPEVVLLLDPPGDCRVGRRVVELLLDLQILEAQAAGLKQYARKWCANTGSENVQIGLVARVEKAAVGPPRSQTRPKVG
jgi:hypothetical protein